ncbi:MAG: arsenosugar biosynthesis radical SAM protein ArsS [Flavobacteriia bacterium]|nr:arsenosugar biosynthesis radical SAM protein ArsS [Flavobacteriia bacterium]
MFLKFSKQLDLHGLNPYLPKNIEILQVNLGKMCNQTCKHCHVDAGPHRKEIMDMDTMQYCLNALDVLQCKTVDITGGAPEMNSNFRWFVEECFNKGVKILIRCNLTIIEANKKYYDLPHFYKQVQVEIISSLPYYLPSKTDAQRGKGVFDKSISALKKLNEIGYGKENSALKLHLVYNPTGAFLPGNQKALESEFKIKLKNLYGIDFSSLFTITNVPINRFLQYLKDSGNYGHYMEKLLQSFNPKAAENTMCRNTLSVSWDGFLYDCDFNQMLDLKVNSSAQHIKNIEKEILLKREIITGLHCYACTAGAGSSCGGETASD